MVCQIKYISHDLSSLSKCLTFCIDGNYYIKRNIFIGIMIYKCCKTSEN